MQRQKLRSNPRKKFGHRNGRSSCAHSIGKFFLCYIVLFSFETSATGSPGNYLYYINWVENSGHTKSHGMPPRPLWVCLQEQWPVDCTHFCMPLLPLSLNTYFLLQAACCQKNVNRSTCAWDCSSRALCEVLLSSQATKVQRILFKSLQ